MSNSKSGKICNFVFGIFIIFQLLPFFKSFSFYHYVNTFLILFWFVISSVRNKEYYMNIKKIILLILVFWIYTFVFPMISNNFIISKRYLYACSIFFYYIVYDYNVKTNNHSKRLIPLTIFCTLITLATTFKALIKSNYVARRIKASGELTISLLGQNIGGYEFIYFIHSLLILYLICTINEKNKKKKIFYIIFVAISFYLVLISNFLTALLVDILIILLIVINYFLVNKKAVIKVFVYTILLIGCVFYKSILISAIDNTIKITGDSFNTTRLLLLKNELNGSDEDIYTGRYEGLKLNVKQTFNYPITGIVVDKIEYENGFLLGFGQHSFITDTFALYGIIIGSLLLYLLLFPIYHFYKKYHKYRIYIFLMGFDLFIILFFNNYDTLLGLVVYYLLPSYFDIYISRENNKCKE